MLAVAGSDPDPDPSENAPRLAPFEAAAPLRYAYATSARSRIWGFVGTAVIYGLMLAVFFVTITSTMGRRPEPPALTVIDLKTAAVPPEAPMPEKPRPRPRPTPPVPQRPLISVPSVAPARAPVTPPPAAAPPALPPVVQAPAPKVAPAPPAREVSSKGPDSWESRVLAALNKQRRYPLIASLRHEQGVPYVRFVMDRKGKVLSSQLERSSGFSELDREAVALPKRAQPLPEPPADRQGDTIELTVPVEFFMK